ncbi:hypothetical protein F511_22932 [Dorcoceras hygrometricum]|uniref:Uncharacterized protein n=1 Tax=Dorcoceras hygrometricum TaxID=472368 RepID=A0A2Z7C496_9LAMI|nr:hypothetical protein F511_22932 [Dorcoceras hygrometricum]
MESAVELAMETSKVISAVRNQADAKLNQLEHDEPAETMTTSCRAKERSEPASTGIDKLAGVLDRTRRCAIAFQEARSYEESQAGAEAMKKSAGALSVDDINSDVIIQQEATVISRKIQQMRRDALDME